MTDLEITRLCAEAMGLNFEQFGSNDKAEILIPAWPTASAHVTRYNPLHDDAQAMALVKKFNLRIFDTMIPPLTSGWIVCQGDNLRVGSIDLNRAICECVAKMQEAK